MLVPFSISFAQEVATEYLDWNRIEEDILRMMKEGDIPGLSVVLVNGDRSYIKGFGYKNLEKKEPVTSRTLFQLASCSKSFTALAIMQVVNEGKVSLNDPVSAFIPWFRVTYKERPVQVTIAQLLHHTSGIPWSTISKIPISKDHNALEKTIRMLEGQELNHSPGKEYEYATINYDVLALVLQEIVQQPFESYLQSNVLNRLGLQYTSIGQPMDEGLMAKGYKIGFFQPRRYVAPIYKGNNAAGYVISNALDMEKWLKAQVGLQADAGLNALIQKTHQRDESVTLHGLSSYAAGWEVSLDGTGEIYHAGLNPNFSTYVVFRPKSKLGVAVLANSNSTYTNLVGDALMKYLAVETDAIYQDVDSGDNVDNVYSIFSIVIAFYGLVVLAVLLRIVVQAFRGKRRVESFNLKKGKHFFVALVNLVPFLLGVYLLPKALAGFTWEAIFVWSPISFKLLLFMLGSATGISLLAYFLSLVFVEGNPYKRIAPQIILFSILSGLSNVVIIAMVTSSLQGNVELKYLVFYYLLVIGVYLVGRKFVQVNLIHFARGLIYDLRVTMINKIFSTSYQKFEKINRGRIYTVLNDDINTIGESTNIVMLLITSVITALGAFVYLGAIAFWATVLTLLLIITLAVVYSIVAQRTERYFEEARDERNTFMQLISGMIDGYKEISLRRNKKLQYKDEVADSAGRYRDKASFADVSFVNAFLIGESLLVILLGGVAFGMPELFPNIKPHSLMSFVIVLLYLIGPINGILSSVPSMINLRVSWNRIQGFLKEIPANIDLQKSPSTLLNPVQSFKAEGITYQYQSDNDERQFAIGPIDLEIKAGEIVFLVGGNGSGKTTLAKILTGLYPADEGTISINNQPVNNFELSEYFSTVFSPPFIFEKLYDIDVEKKRSAINEYLRLLDLAEKVAIKEDRYSTIHLSTGQRKRLALLQCYLEDAPIYLFDEWAADQDPGYRVFFYNTLLPEMKKAGKIVLAITHDDHYFHVADKVLKMDGGKFEHYPAQSTWKTSEVDLAGNIMR